LYHCLYKVSQSFHIFTQKSQQVRTLKLQLANTTRNISRIFTKTQVSALSRKSTRGLHWDNASIKRSLQIRYLMWKIAYLSVNLSDNLYGLYTAIDCVCQIVSLVCFVLISRNSYWYVKIKWKQLKVLLLKVYVLFFLQVHMWCHWL
jgi:hypothetical protein